METRNQPSANRVPCQLAEDRALLGEVAKEISRYSARETCPPPQLIELHRELIQHFAAVSQGR